MLERLATAFGLATAAGETKDEKPTYSEPTGDGGKGSKLKCTYCGGTEWFDGPEGGMSVNVLCANPKCRHWFNWTAAIGTLDDLKRVEPTKEEREAQETQRKVAAANVEEERFQEGWKAYTSGKPIRSLMTDKPYGNYGAAAWNVERLLGYVQAMQEDLAKLRSQTHYGSPAED